MKNPYSDIINLPHHQSVKHPHMPARDRAAQFSPFAALTGYDAAVKETARLTDKRIELDEHEKANINGKLNDIKEQLPDRPEITVAYFKSDEKKSGGAYLTVAGEVKKVDEYACILIMTDGLKIPFDDIAAIDFIENE